MPQFSHACIDNGITGEALSPRPKRIGIVPPGKGPVCAIQRFVDGMRKMVEEISCEFPPDYLSGVCIITFSIRRIAIFLFSMLDGMPKFSGANFSEMQMRGHAGGMGEVRSIPIYGIDLGGIP